jgi:hypothetical protein
MLFGGHPDNARAMTAALRAAALPVPHRFRVQEAWAAVARHGAWYAPAMATHPMRACLETVMGGVPADGTLEAATAGQVLEAARRGEAPTLLARLRGLGAAVLGEVAAGQVHHLGPLEGLALAATLGRLQAVQAPV